MFFLVFLLYSLTRFSFTVCVSCRDDYGNPVEWFIGYKMPDSLNYHYLIPGLNAWRMSEFTIDKKGMMKNTFDKLFELKNRQSALYGIYNDENPKFSEEYSSKWGHLKGAIAFDRSSGFWIIHSIPKLSELPDRYQYPSSGYTYGQHMLCVTLGTSYVAALIEQLSISGPQFLSSYVSADMKDKYPQIAALFDNHHHKHQSHNRTAVFESLNSGLKMRHFSKSNEFGKDLYLDLVSPSLGHGLKVETWRHGQSEPSVCKRNKPWVVNVEYLKFDNPKQSFSSFTDHAKWATTIPTGDVHGKKDMWVCLGDINRMYSQFHRGGGTMCIENKTIWKAFTNLISKVEQCSHTYSDDNDQLYVDL